ncbi:hypothetical protein UFOVP448_10 [uncultured Caudovirales phage]|uniref:Uncharacterized protein n=1 Tax=uncultured Caudovirales phage TaxID=2100421 RepID=A0A6J5M8F0_9CAUD|nr:hypothetical protein UFOVP448_10 [uncultured Caudovirales phage]
MSVWTPKLSFQSSASVSNGGSAYNGWTNHALALTANSDHAYTILYGVDESYRLNLTNLNGIASEIASGSTILGFKTSITGFHTTTGGGSDYANHTATVRMIKGGTVNLSATLGSGTIVAASSTITIGGTSSLGGLTFTRDEAVASNTGISIQTTRQVGGDDEGVDKVSIISFVQLEVFFNPPASNRVQSAKMGIRMGCGI